MEKASMRLMGNNNFMNKSEIKIKMKGEGYPQR